MREVRELTVPNTLAMAMTASGLENDPLLDKPEL
jgi:hypothetical protein